MRARMLAPILGLALVTVAGASPDTPATGRTGAYVGGGVLYAVEDLDDAGVGFGDSWGFDARGGYRVHRNIAVEGQLQYFDEFGAGVSTPFGRADLDLQGLAVTANAKGYPLTGRIQPYSLLGIGFSWFEATARLRGLTATDSSVDFVFRGGGGIDFYLTDHVVLNAEATYLLVTGDFDNGGVIPIVLGVHYRF